MKQHKRCLCHLLNQKLWSFPSSSLYFWQCRCSFHSSPSPSSQWRRWTYWHASRCCWTSSWSLQLGQSPLCTPASPAGLVPLPMVPKWSRYGGRLRTAKMNNKVAHAEWDAVLKRSVNWTHSWRSGGRPPSCCWLDCWAGTGSCRGWSCGRVAWTRFHCLQRRLFCCLLGGAGRPSSILW